MAAIMASAKQWVMKRVPVLRGVPLVRGSLTDIGWFRSWSEGLPVEADGRPLPWFTYPAIDLVHRVPSDARVLEFGSGNSTLWWSERTAEVVAVEHDAGWAERAERLAPSNASVIHRPETPAYEEAAAELGSFDVIVIDGVRRVECARPALAALTARGVIVWDNSERPEYAPGMELLRATGLRQLDLWGLAPGFDNWGSTSIFYRDGNCLGL